MVLLEATTDGQIIIAYVIGFIISLLILGFTISTAIRVDKRDKHSLITIKLLSAIAEKNGVPIENIKSILQNTDGGIGKDEIKKMFETDK